MADLPENPNRNVYRPFLVPRFSNDVVPQHTEGVLQFRGRIADGEIRK